MTRVACHWSSRREKVCSWIVRTEYVKAEPLYVISVNDLRKTSVLISNYLVRTFENSSG